MTGIAAVSFWPLGAGSLAIDDAIRTVAGDPSADYRDNYAPAALLSLGHIVVILVPALAVLNGSVARRAVPGRHHRLAWPVSISIALLPLVMETMVSWAQWFVWSR